MSQTAKPAGHVPVPLMIFGFVSLLLGVAIEVLGVMKMATEELRGMCEEGGLILTKEMGLPGLEGVLVTGAACFGLIAAILGTPGGGRRMVLGASAMFLTLSLILAFAVWGIFWKPFGMIVAVAWAWLSAGIYARSHRMPCEGSLEPVAPNVIDLGEGRGGENFKRYSDGQR